MLDLLKGMRLNKFDFVTYLARADYHLSKSLVGSVG